MKIPYELRLQIAKMMRAHVRFKYGTQAAAADAWGCNPTFVCAVLAGDKAPNDLMMQDANIKLVAKLKRSK